jgi:hypothetical protein
MECGIERALFDDEEIVGDSTDMHDDAVSVHGAKLGERLEYEEIERALEIVFCHRP